MIDMTYVTSSFAAVGFFAIVALVLRHRFESMKRDKLQSWRELAERMSGTFQEPVTGLLSSRSASLEVELGEASMLADTVVTGFVRNGTHRVHTRLRAHLLVSSKLRFRIYARSIVKNLNKLFTLPLSALNDERFDRIFVVKASDPVLTRELWTSRARDLLLGKFRDAMVSCRDGIVRIDVPRFLDGHDLKDAFEILGELANVDIYGLQELESLPGSEYQPPSGPWDNRTLPFVELDEPHCVTIGPVTTASQQIATRADVEDVLFKGSLELAVEDGGELDESVDEIPFEAASMLGQVGAGVLSVRRGRASFQWDGIETDRYRLEAGAHLLRAFCKAQPEGVYR